MNTITVNFIECDTPPAQGYNLKWRVAGSGDPYTDEGLFSGSPIVFIDNINPEGTCYEGILQSNCSESGESGSGALLGEEIPWSTPCPESGSTYEITLVGGCSSPFSNFTVIGGTPGDVIVVRATFAGLLQKTSALFTRADVGIASPDGTSDLQSSACYSDASPHGFSITADTTITIPGSGTTTVTTTAVIHNGSESPTNLVVSIISINGDPHSEIFASGCKGNSATGGTC